MVSYLYIRYPESRQLKQIISDSLQHEVETINIRDSSLTFFPVFVVLYLEIVENIDHIHKNTFPITS